MAYEMTLQRGKESYTVVIPAEEYSEIGKDPELIGKYWEIVSMSKMKKVGTQPPGTTEDQEQVTIQRENGESYWDSVKTGHLISLAEKHNVDIHEFEVDSILWDNIATEMNAVFPTSTIDADDCFQAFKKLLKAYEVMKSDEKNCAKKGKLFNAIEKIVESQNQLQVQINENDNQVSERLEAEKREHIINLPEPVVFMPDDEKESMIIPVVSQSIETEKESETFKVPATTSSTMTSVFNSEKLPVRKRTRKRKKVVFSKGEKKARSISSSNPLPLSKTSMSLDAVKQNSKCVTNATSSNDELIRTPSEMCSQCSECNESLSETFSQDNKSETFSQNKKVDGSNITSVETDEFCGSSSGKISQGDSSCKINRLCYCQNEQPPQWFCRFEKQLESKWECLVKIAQEQINIVNGLVSVLTEWPNVEKEFCASCT